MKTMYIQTFSKGQMTVPKAIRKQWGVTDEFWLKLTLEEDNSLRLEPMEQSQDVEKHSNVCNHSRSQRQTSLVMLITPRLSDQQKTSSRKNWEIDELTLWSV